MEQYKIFIDVLNKIIDMCKQTAIDQYGDEDKVGLYSCYRIAKEALDKCGKPVSAPSVSDDLRLTALPEPIGKFVLDQKDIPHTMGADGAYWHYKDVLTLLKRYKEYVPWNTPRQIAGVQWVNWINCAKEMPPDNFANPIFRFIHTKQPLLNARYWLSENWGSANTVEWLDESGSSLSTAAKEQEKLYKEANQFILDLAKEFGEDSLGFDGIQWSIEDFKEAAKKYSAAKEQETAIAFAEWMDINGCWKNPMKGLYYRYGVNKGESLSELHALFLQSQNK